MSIYLVQHGQAESEEVDPQRHLTEKGIADVKKISAFLKAAQVHVDSVWHSGKARAAQTADILGKAVEAKNMVQRKGLAPNDDITAIRDELTKSGVDIMIVGHLPFLSKLASSLVAGDESADIVAFQQGGLVCLEQNEDKSWEMRWMVVPELLP
jgi:phosphohistidine phosphatase